MSKYEETRETEGYKCPYCGHMPTCDDWGHDYEGEEYECDECGKVSYATAIHTVDFETTPNCLLNNEEHVYTETKTLKSGGLYSNCDICGEYLFKNHDPEGWKKYFGDDE